jgi:hypothetical protein
VNCALEVIALTLEADKRWFFSRMGTHCLENFFGLVHLSSLADDRSVTALRIIVKANMVAQVMHELDMKVCHHGRDNVGGVVISGYSPAWRNHMSDRLCRTMIALSELEVDPRDQSGVLSVQELRTIPRQWEEADGHQIHDPVSRANFEGKSSNSQICPRPMAAERSRVVGREDFLLGVEDEDKVDPLILDSSNTPQDCSQSSEIVT